MSEVTPAPTSAYAALRVRKNFARSRVGTGKALFLDRGDHRTARGRRFRETLTQIIDDLGGPAVLSEAQIQLARRCAMISLACEELECRSVLHDEEIDLDLFGQLTDRLGRTFQRLGIKRAADHVASPKLEVIIAAHTRKARQPTINRADTLRARQLRADEQAEDGS